MQNQNNINLNSFFSFEDQFGDWHYINIKFDDNEEEAKIQKDNLWKALRNHESEIFEKIGKSKKSKKAEFDTFLIQLGFKRLSRISLHRTSSEMIIAYTSIILLLEVVAFNPLLFIFKALFLLISAFFPFLYVAILPFVTMSITQMLVTFVPLIVSVVISSILFPVAHKKDTKMCELLKESEVDINIFLGSNAALKTKFDNPKECKQREISWSAKVLPKLLNSKYLGVSLFLLFALFFVLAFVVLGFNPIVGANILLIWSMAVISFIVFCLTYEPSYAYRENKPEEKHKKEEPSEGGSIPIPIPIPIPSCCSAEPSVATNTNLDLPEGPRL